MPDGSVARRCLCAGAAWSVAVWALAADAQVVYQWRQPNGTVVYAHKPPTPSQGTLMRTLSLAELEGNERAAVSRIGINGLPPSDPSRQALAGADAEVAMSVLALQRAEKALQRGQTPTAADRSGLAGGRSRLTEAYFERLSSLEAQVQESKRQLQLAYSKREALGNL